jgi:cbb3-type cytochrome oxidase subunit 3
MMTLWLIFAGLCLAGLVFMLRFQKKLAARAAQAARDNEADREN